MTTNRTENDTSASVEEVEHTADWALRIRGCDLRELMVHAARGMGQLLVADLDALPQEVEEDLVIDAYDAESLLVNWLNELAYHAEMRGIIFTVFEIEDVTATHLQATVRGGRVPQLQKHIKAATYHNLVIVKTEEGLEATVVFDV
jgi:SHS2 domain-containing protein